MHAHVVVVNARSIYMKEGENMVDILTTRSGRKQLQRDDDIIVIYSISGFVLGHIAMKLPQFPRPGEV